MSRTKAPRADKVKVVSVMRTVSDQASSAIITEYRGMTVFEVSALRRKLRPTGAEYHVVKNTLFKRALGDKLTPELKSLLVGPTAVAFTTDPIETSKALIEFLRLLRKPHVRITGGVVEGRVCSVEQLTALSKLPGRDAVRAQAVGTIQAPLNNFVGTLNGVAGEFVRTLQSLADKLGAEG